MAEDEIKRAWSNLQNSPRPDVNKSIAVDVVAELDLREGCAISREMTRFLNVTVYYVLMLIYFLTYLLVNFIFLKNAARGKIYEIFLPKISLQCNRWRW